MITAETIAQIRSVAPSEVISKFVTIKKKGVNWSGCCPFHNEKTPSFSVNDVKGIFKCFGCGQGGDTIEFIIQHEKKSFYEACITVAELAGITVEYEENHNSEKQKIARSAAEVQEQVLNFCIPIFHKEFRKLPPTHPAKIWLQQRNFSMKKIEEWQIGWSPDEWSFITPRLINNNWYEAGSQTGLIRRKNDSNYDGYRSRIIIPIKDRNGRNIGLGGRYIKVSANDAFDIPKYVNPPQSELYNKSSVLFGLKEAAAGIKQSQFAIVTEGYMDVIVPHCYGWKDVVATCGTAFTTDQMRLLKKYTSHLIMMRDNDSAGRDSFHKSLPELLRAGFRVDVMLYEGKDPDEYVRLSSNYDNPVPAPWPTVTDAFLHRAKVLWNDAEEPHQKAEAKREILDLLKNVANDIFRNHYLDIIVKDLKWKASETKKEFTAMLETVPEQEPEQNEPIKFAPWMSEEQKDAFLAHGYISVDRKHNGKPMVGYYTFGSGGKTEITNFTVKPLFHVYAGTDSRFLVEIYNGYRKAVLDVPAKNIPSPEQFQSYTVSEGNFLIFGAKNQWLRIASELLQSFPRCTELKELGWQSYHFFSWVDKIFIPEKGLVNLDEWGIFKYKDENYLVPASCIAYKQLQNTGDDLYENDRYLSYKEGPLSFSQWADLMVKVYKQKGTVGIAYTVLTIFRDIIFSVENNCPHLYGFGEPSSGKSKWAESLAAIFYHKRSAFNLNSGTDFAFFNYMQRYQNCPSHLNEFDIEFIKPEWFQAIKGVYDGEGRERGKQNGPKNRTEVMRVRSTLILTGQKLVTADDNSVVSRSIIEPFSVEEYDEDRKLYFDELKHLEGKGMSNILLEILQHRDLFEKDYRNNLNAQLARWRKIKEPEFVQLNQRILQNFAHLATCYKMISGFISLPQPAEDYTEYCYKQVLKWSHFIRNSDTLSEFWRTIEFFANQRDIEEGWDYIVEELQSVSIRVHRDETKVVEFEKPKKLLFLRLNNVHKLYQSAFRNRTGKEGMSLENLLHYFSSRKYYVGSQKKKRFSRFIQITQEVSRHDGTGLVLMPETLKKKEEKMTSCYVFLYDQLDIDISNDPFEMVPENEASEDLELPF